MTDPLRLPSPSADPELARAAHEALRRHVAFLEDVAGDPNAPRAERLRALELLAQIAGPAAPGGHAGGPATKQATKHAAKHASKHAAKHAAKQASKHAAKHASKHASKHAAKPATKRVAGGAEPRRLTDPGTTRRLSSGPGASRALPPGR